MNEILFPVHHHTFFFNTEQRAPSDGQQINQLATEGDLSCGSRDRGIKLLLLLLTTTDYLTIVNRIYIHTVAFS